MYTLVTGDFCLFWINIIIIFAIYTFVYFRVWNYMNILNFELHINEKNTVDRG